MDLEGELRCKNYFNKIPITCKKHTMKVYIGLI